MSFSSTKKVTLRYSDPYAGKCWELEGDFTNFINAVSASRDYASLDTVPVLKVENGVVSVFKGEGFRPATISINTWADINSLVTELEKYQRGLIESI